MAESEVKPLQTHEAPLQGNKLGGAKAFTKKSGFSSSNPKDQIFGQEVDAGRATYQSNYGQWEARDEHLNRVRGNIPHDTRNPSNDGTVVYYVPGYDPFASSALMGNGGEHVGQSPYCSEVVYSQAFPSSGCLLPHIPYGSDGLPTFVPDNMLAGTCGGRSGFSNPNSTSARYPARNSWHLKGAPMGNAEVSSRTSSAEIFASMKGYVRSHNGPWDSISKNRHWYGSEAFNIKGTASTRTGKYSSDILADQVRGPRGGCTENPQITTEPLDYLSPASRRDLFNLPDFQTKYDDALFFVIKSYSEDNIHRSIKYNVWSSTPAGNRKLDSAFQVANERSREKGSTCPVFLFFSVNASGYFCGLAEMVGKVDFTTNMDFWQRDKWTGFFPVKWHVVKDIPNSHLRHIILENNESKPVTNSRDTQEIKFSQGLEMLQIFKDYEVKESVLDDFAFYEKREEKLQERRDTQTLLDNEITSESDDMVKEDNDDSEGPSLALLTKNLSISS